MKMVVPKRSLVWEMLPPLLCVLAWCQTVSEVGGCGFVGLLSSCSMTVGGIELQASARINHCHSPIDITFLLQSINNVRTLLRRGETTVANKYNKCSKHLKDLILCYA